MQPFDEPAQPRHVSIPSLTAWLSLCILAAAWGQSLDERWQGIWINMGAYGLAASLGLGVLEKAHLSHQRKLQDCALRAHIECGLEKLNEQVVTLDSISAAIRRLHVCAAHHANGTPKKDRHRGRSSRWSRLPMEIAPVVNHDESCCELAGAIPGSLRDISSRGVSFCHAQPFVAPVAVLAFELGDNERLSFVVDVLWTKASPEGFITGGTVLAVGVPAPQEERRELAALAASGPA